MVEDVHYPVPGIGMGVKHGYEHGTVSPDSLGVRAEKVEMPRIEPAGDRLEGYVVFKIFEVFGKELGVPGKFDGNFIGF